MSHDVFTETYYQTGNYANYLKRADRYVRLAAEIRHDVQEAVLDYGCAVGFLVQALCGLGLDCTGYDPSEWAIHYGIEVLGISAITTDRGWVNRSWGTLVCLDVLEHMPLPEIHSLLGTLDVASLLVRIPVSDGNGFVLDISRRDITHITCLTKREWEEVFAGHGFRLEKTLDYHSIWDSEGVLSRLYVKDRP